MRAARPELTDEQIRDLRHKLSDEGYMDKAISGLAADLVNDMFKGDGSDEPTSLKSGRKPVIKTE